VSASSCFTRQHGSASKALGRSPAAARPLDVFYEPGVTRHDHAVRVTKRSFFAVFFVVENAGVGALGRVSGAAMRACQKKTAAHRAAPPREVCVVIPSVSGRDPVAATGEFIARTRGVGRSQNGWPLGVVTRRQRLDLTTSVANLHRSFAGAPPFALSLVDASDRPTAARGNVGAPQRFDRRGSVSSTATRPSPPVTLRHAAALQTTTRFFVGRLDYEHLNPTGWRSVRRGAQADGSAVWIQPGLRAHPYCPPVFILGITRPLSFLEVGGFRRGHALRGKTSILLAAPTRRP